MIGRVPRRTAGRIPAVLSIGMLLLLSACSHYGPMNRNLVSLDPDLGKAIDLENAEFGVAVAKDDAAVSIVGRDGRELQLCRPPADQAGHASFPKDAPPCRLLDDNKVTVQRIQKADITVIQYEINPTCYTIISVINGRVYYHEYCL